MNTLKLSVISVFPSRSKQVAPAYSSELDHPNQLVYRDYSTGGGILQHTIV